MVEENIDDNDDKLSKEGITTLKNLLPFLSNYRNLLIVGTIGMIISVVISFFMGIAIRFVIDGFPTDPTEASVFLDKVLIFGFMFIFITAVTGYVTAYCLRKVATCVTKDIRCNVFNSIINHDIEYIEKQSSGEMQTRIVADANAVGNFLSYQIPIILTALLSLIVGVIGAFYISVKMTLIVIGCLPLIFSPFLVLSKRLRKLGELIQSAISDVGRYSGESFRNIKVVRAYNKEKEENNKINGIAGVVVKHTLSIARLEIGLSSSVDALALAGFATLLWSAGKDIYAGSMTIGQLVAFAYFTLFIVQSAVKFVGIATTVSITIGRAKKLLEYLAKENHLWPSSISHFQSQGAIEFKGINFSYPNRPDIAVLEDINLVIKSGSNIAIVGSSGAGKSTIFELLLRFYDLQQGKIFLDGEDVINMDANQLRSFIGYVPQKGSLITGTVFENIAYGIDRADEASVIAAAKMTHADDFIQKLPQGYNTDLGEVGDRLSGGQKQRISLARALIRNPQILLLDEAKSALDAESERLVAQTIEHWAETRKATVITIAHRLSTVQNADLIVVIDNGCIMGQGSHEQLIESCDMYQKLYYSDLQDFESNELEAV